MGEEKRENKSSSEFQSSHNEITVESGLIFACADRIGTEMRIIQREGDVCERDFCIWSYGSGPGGGQVLTNPITVF